MVLSEARRSGIKAAGVLGSPKSPSPGAVSSGKNLVEGVSKMPEK